MKKLLGMILSLALVFSCAAVFTGCKKEAKTYEIAVVTDVGQLKDGGFNQGTYEGAQAFAEANNKTYKYYQPANGSEATDNDRIAAMRQAIKNGAKIIVAPGYLQANAMTKVATESPSVKFVFIDGWTLTDEAGKPLPNVTAVVYKEQESGYLAGYAAVMDGFTKLGATLGGGGSNPACNRFGYGFVQGAEAAAKVKYAADASKKVEIKYSYKYGTGFSASANLQTQISGWYNDGTEVVFACGGSMFSSVKAAAEENATKDNPDNNPRIIGVDVDQAPLSEYVITSAVKGLKESVQLILKEYYEKEENWANLLGGKTSNLGAKEDATGLPTAASSWRFRTFTVAEYKTLFDGIKNGTVKIKSDVPENANDPAWLQEGLTKVTIKFESEVSTGK